MTEANESFQTIGPHDSDMTHLFFSASDYSPSTSDSEDKCVYRLPPESTEASESDDSSCSEIDPCADFDSMPPKSAAASPYMKENSMKLPFQSLSRSWYRKEQRLYNIARDRLRNTRSIERDSAIAFNCMNRSLVQGSLESNLQSLHYKLNSGCSTAKACHYQAVCAVATLINHGPLVKTQEAGKVYLEYKGLDKRKRSWECYENFSKHLNLVQVSLTLDTCYQILAVRLSLINTIKGTVNQEAIVHKALTDSLKGLVTSSLEYMDTHRDRQVLKALLAELTSVNFTAKLQGLQSRQGTASAKKALRTNLQKYDDIKRTSQIVRSDMTTTQHHLTQRIISSRKLHEIRTIAEGHGRELLNLS